MNYLPPVSIIEDKMPMSDHDPDAQDSDGLLKASESVYSWTYSDREDDRHRGFWWIVGMIIAISALSCLTGLFIGYQHHHSDKTCSRRTSHYCTAFLRPQGVLFHADSNSYCHVQCPNKIPPAAVQRVPVEREYLSPGRRPGSRRRVGSSRCEL